MILYICCGKSAGGNVMFAVDLFRASTCEMTSLASVSVYGVSRQEWVSKHAEMTGSVSQIRGLAHGKTLSLPIPGKVCYLICRNVQTSLASVSVYGVSPQEWVSKHAEMTGSVSQIRGLAHGKTLSLPIPGKVCYLICRNVQDTTIIFAVYWFIHTVGCRYNAVQHDVMLYTALLWLKQNISQNLYSRKTPHILVKLLSYGGHCLCINTCIHFLF